MIGALEQLRRHLQNPYPSGVYTSYHQYIAASCHNYAECAAYQKEGERVWEKMYAAEIKRLDSPPQCLEARVPMSMHDPRREHGVQKMRQ